LGKTTWDFRGNLFNKVSSPHDSPPKGKILTNQ